MDLFISCITEKYALFDGRASRSEYWLFQLFEVLILIGTMALGAAAENIADLGTDGALSIGATGITYLLMFIPNLAVTVRRLHDTGKSAWLLLLSFIPFGAFVLFIFTVMDSDPYLNQYGENPKMLA